jgi:hypothetical protein
LLQKDQRNINGWELTLETEIREVVQEQENLYVIAENEELGVLCVRAGDKSGKPIYVNFERGEEVVVESSFTDFLKSTAVPSK